MSAEEREQFAEVLFSVIDATGAKTLTDLSNAKLKNFGVILTNSIGIIDNSYSGTNDIWLFPAYCLQPKDIGCNDEGQGTFGTWIHKNDRIAQFRIVKSQPTIEFVEVDELDETDRGGYGSTGIK